MANQKPNNPLLCCGVRIESKLYNEEAFIEYFSEAIGSDCWAAFFRDPTKPEDIMGMVFDEHGLHEDPRRTPLYADKTKAEAADEDGKQQAPHWNEEQLAIPKTMREKNWEFVICYWQDKSKNDIWKYLPECNKFIGVFLDVEKHYF